MLQPVLPIYFGVGSMGWQQDLSQTMIQTARAQSIASAVRRDGALIAAQRLIGYGNTRQNL